MPAIINWFLRLLPTNPIVMRIVQGGSRRLRHLYIRAGYLGILMGVLLLLMLGGSNANTYSQLSANGAKAFEYISFLQLGLICLLTPVFMAGAIAQEANPRTWDILLTTPLNNLQIVLGNLFGRLFFILALLFSTLPLFVAIQYFGGVPGEAIFMSYVIAGGSAVLVGAIAVMLSVTRTAGKRAVFIFYIAVVMYLFVTYFIDAQFLRREIAPGAAVYETTILTPLNPFLAIEVLLRSNTYSPHNFAGVDAFWLKKLWLGSPIATFSWLCGLLSAILITFSTVRLRVIGAKVGTTSWLRRIFKLGAKGATERPPRKVGHNPIAWRESVARGATMQAIVTRWGFAGFGLLVAIIVITLFHAGMMGTIDQGAPPTTLRTTADNFRVTLWVILSAEVVIIALTALNTSATAVSREREDGSLDIMLTTPIQPGPYLAGKLRGLIQFLLPMLCVPIGTMLLASLYVIGGGFGNKLATSAPMTVGATPITLPIVLPEGVIALTLVLIPFIAFCVMVGLQWSIKSRGTIGSVIAAVGLVIAVTGVVGMCGAFAGRNDMGVIGAVLNAFNPINLAIAIVAPDTIMPDAIDTGTGVAGTASSAGARVALMIGAVLAGVVYVAIVYGMHANMVRTFHMTVRKLAGQK
jgi:ABC-type transport system involved in multi-copper enzyme maturation permease subunit